MDGTEPMFPKKIGFFSAAISVALWSPFLHADGWMTDLEQAKVEAQKANRPIVVHFWAEWCPPCKRMEREILGQPPVLDALRDKVVGVKVNLDENRDLATRFGIEKLPSDIYLNPQGERIMESSGPANTVTDYVKSLNRAARRNTELAKKVPVQTTPGSEESKIITVSRKPMLDGYCPVALFKHRKWDKGAESFKLEYRGQLYQFATAESMQEFKDNPAHFAPRFLGCDPVKAWEDDKAIAGSTKYAAFYDQELFLFSTKENRTKFKDDPDRFIRTRVVIDLREIEDGPVSR